ncbi:hypothetical protein LP420_23745 [Massilia sp. B-10]|nr:hypothetical protein LP420_23745 [Massilia sp. B-10]
MMSTAITVAFSRPVRTIAVRFKPGAAAHFFDLPLHALADQHPALADLWEAGAAERCAEALWSKPLSDTRALAVIEQLLLQRLRRADPRPAAVDAAVRAIETARGAIRIEALAEQLGVSRQHLAKPVPRPRRPA